MAVAGALALGVSAVLGIVFALAKKKWLFHLYLLQFYSCVYSKLFHWSVLSLRFLPKYKPNIIYI